MSKICYINNNNHVTNVQFNFVALLPPLIALGVGNEQLPLQASILFM